MLSRQCIIFSIIFVVDSLDMNRTTTPSTTKNTAFICHSVWTAGFGHKSTRCSIILFEMDCMNKCINLLKCYGFSVVTFDRTCCINIYRKLFNSDRTREFGILASKLVDFFSEIWHSFRLCGSRSSSLTFSFLSFTHTLWFFHLSSYFVLFNTNTNGVSWSIGLGPEFIEIWTCVCCMGTHFVARIRIFRFW